MSRRLRTDFHILLDIDGVLANFVEHFCDWFDVPNPYKGGQNRGVWDVVKLTGLTDSCWSDINDEDFWMNIPKLPEADEIISAVLKRFHPDHVCLLSSPLKMPWSMPGKVFWIRMNYPQFEQHFLFGAQKQFCAHEDSVLIDDYEHNTDTFERHGGQAFLVPRPWNKRHQEEPQLVQILNRWLDAL